MNKPRQVRVLRWVVGTTVSDHDAVAVEEPLELRVADRSVAVVMRTPGHDRELAAGFLLTEGVIRHADDLLDILPCRDQSGGASGNVINAVLAPSVTVDFNRLTRHVFSSSSCGVCGKATLDAILQTYPPVVPGAVFDPHQLAALPERLRAAQPAFAATGGLHACALFNAAGELEFVHEDVGRHNALDKVLGRALLERIEALAPERATTYTLFTGAGSVRNQRLYKKAGYRLLGESPFPGAVGLAKRIRRR